MGKIVLAVTSDHHCGSSVALCPNEQIPLDDGGVYSPSKAQRWLWDSWHTFWERVDAVRKEHKAALYTEFNGDVTEGHHHGSGQVVSGIASVEADIVGKTLAVPMALKPDKVFFVRGTETHVGKSGCREESIARGLASQGYNVQREPHTGNHSWYNLRADINGTYVSFAHHGRIGRLPWTRPNGTISLAMQICINHWKRGEDPPKLCFRSHFHKVVDTWDMHPARVIQTPAWQLHTAFTHKVVPESLADIGGIIVVFDGKDFEVEKVLFEPSRGPLWKDK